jgi:hypothetical protein
MNAIENTTQKSAAYYAGLESKKLEISGMGFDAARDKFNSDHPPGVMWTGSVEGLEFAHGEFAALVDCL